MTENPLIDVGGLAKPATVLIEKISNAVGVVYAPTHVRRMAAAEADAAQTHALAQIEISDIERRGFERLVREQGRKQHNMESITKLALEDLKPDAKPENIEDDWIANYFEKCRNVSNEEMQSLWAKVLAGEANRSRSFFSSEDRIFVNNNQRRCTQIHTILHFLLDGGQHNADDS